MAFPNASALFCRQSGWPLLLFASALLIAPYCFGQEQRPSAAVEKFEGVFDAAVVYQPAPGEYGITELMSAALDGNTAKVETLIQAGADVNAVDDGGATALLRAAAYGHLEIVNRLLAANANPEPVSSAGRNALSVAVKYKSIAVALTLLQHGANPNAYLNANRPKWRRSVLEHAAVTGQTDVVAALIENGANIGADGPAAFKAALWKGYADIVATLIDAGVDVNASFVDPNKSENAQTATVALHTASMGGHLGIVQLLLRHGANIDATDLRGQTALHYAIRHRHFPVAKFLLANDAAVSVENLSAAMNANDNDLAPEILQRINLANASLVEIEALISVADQAGEDQIVIELFAARAMLKPDDSPPLFLFARRDIENCELIRWRPHEKTELVVFEERGKCGSQFFASDDARWLFVVSDDNIQVISLVDGRLVETIALPTQQISGDLAELKVRVRESYGSNATNAEEWMKADVAQVGHLENGDLMLVTHTGGPADETYGSGYVRSGNAWQQADRKNCGRFDWCRFPQVLSQPLNTIPSSQAVWHANVRANPYFKSKSTTPDPQGEWAGWDGTVVLEINGAPSILRYSTGEGGHCSEDCVYTATLKLQVAGQEEVVLAKYSGSNAIVDRYALVTGQQRGSTELIDLATGESVFGTLQVAGWVP